MKAKRLATIAAAAAAVVVLPACGDDGDAGGLRSCAELDGQVLTAEDWARPQCIYEGREQVGHGNDCVDGRVLHGNEALWGFAGEAVTLYVGDDDPAWDAALDDCLGLG